MDNTGACLPVDKNNITHSAIGMCSEANKTSGIVWGYDFCPSSFGYMALVGMVLYLLIFGQGEISSEVDKGNWVSFWPPHKAMAAAITLGTSWIV